MKRSEINAIIRNADKFIGSFGFKLPPFAYWSVDDFKAKRADAQGIFSARLGWDITDFGLGDFARTGLFLFTVRNGRISDLSKGKGMLYAEKIMISRNGQQCPMHKHVIKAEDIINRGGGTLVLELYGSDAGGKLDGSSPFTVATDGLTRHLKAGDKIKLAPGESVTLTPGIWHSFWGEGKDVLVGEVSTVNDDLTDNVFRDKIGRFPAIDEDEPPLYPLVGDYERLI